MRNRKPRILAVLLVMAMVFTTNYVTVTVKAADAAIDLQVLATSDMHGRFVPYDYAINTVDTSGSLAQVATVVKQLRSQNPNTLLLDCGDTIQDNNSEIFLKEETHPMIAGMNQLGYDAVTLGNHEFNYGMDVLKKVMKQSKAAVLCGNVYNPDGTGIADKYTIIEKAGVKIGIIGMVTPNIVRWDAGNLKGYKVTNPVEETKAVIKEIKGKVDLIIAVDHMDENGEYNVKGSSIKSIAEACPEIDLIVAGHEHKAVPGTYYNNVLTVENKSGGQTLAQVDIKIEKGADGKYKVVNRSSKLVDTKDYQADSDMVNALAKYDQMAKKDANVVIGKLVGGDLVPQDEIQGIAQVQLQETSMMNLINQVQLYYSGADVSAAACFSLFANMKEGDIKRCDTALIYKFANTLYKLEVTGAQLKKYMEWSATYYNTYKDGDLTISFNPNIRAYLYDTFAGVRYNINISKEPGNRIENLTRMNGTPIKDTDVLTLAVNNYRATSQLLSYGAVFKEGEALPKLLEKDIHGEIGGIRELIGDYIVNVKGGVIKPETAGSWKITGNDWNPEFHQKVVELVESKKLAVPTSEDGRDSNVRAITKADIADLVVIDKPATVIKVKAKSAKKVKTFTVTYKAVPNAVKYQIMYSKDKNFKKGVKSVYTTKTSKTLKTAKSKTKYYVKVRAIKYDLKDNVLYGKYSKKASVKVK